MKRSNQDLAYVAWTAVAVALLAMMVAIGLTYKQRQRLDSMQPCACQQDVRVELSPGKVEVKKVR